MTQPSIRSTTPLAHSELAVSISDLTAEYELRHVFRNEGTDAIEAIYSFPVPLDAAFMGMEATLAGERLVAQVLPRSRATRDYDNAITEGNSAVLLERLEPGMLCVNLGNLKPGEQGEIVLRFAAGLRCAGGAARFSLPLVHRPRYGRSRLDELVEPRHDFAVEHPLEAVIRVRGLLASAPVSCATHAARFASSGDGQELRLNQAMLDRDLVLVFELPADFTGQARLVRDGDAAISMVTFALPPGAQATHACDVCLVMDGSGSMTGDAIAQSRAALRSAAGMLGDDDRVQVLRFGSSVVPQFRRPLKASTRVRKAVGELSDTLASDLGGTEIGSALMQAIRELGGLDGASDRTKAIILVTDGAVEPGEIKTAQTFAQTRNIRIFIVAVGSSAGADVLAPLATATGAVLERAVPAEPIDEAVSRHLRRAREAGPTRVEIDWGNPKAQPLPVEPVYAGDAVTAMAFLPGTTDVAATVRIGEGHATHSFRASATEDTPALRALAGHAAWRHAQGEAREALALRYGLVTDETSAVLVKVREGDEKAEGLPVIMPVAHMVPEGMVAALKPRVLLCMGSEGSGDDPYGPFDDSSRFLYFDRPARASERRQMYSIRKRARSDSYDEAAPDTAMLEALARVLVQVLLDDEASEVTIEELLALIDDRWRGQASEYLAAKCPNGVNQRSALALLEKLLEDQPDIVLSDDQEALLACAAQRSAAQQAFAKY